MQWPPPNYLPDHGTGYQLTREHVRRLVHGPEYRSVIAPMLKDWFGYEIIGDGLDTTVRASNGSLVSLDVLHEQTQRDPKTQYYLYQRAMDFWR